MPKRSNTFQRLIYHLHEQFDKTATVTESKMMKDPETGSNVEVDIVIETEVSGIPLLVGIECTSKSRPATIEWYRQLVQKHKDLRIAKTVLVSESGFTKDVYKKAELNRVTLLTLEEAVDKNWLDWVRKIDNGSMMHIGFTPTSFELSVDKESLITPDFFQVSHTSMVQISDDILPIRQYITDLLQVSGITRQILENAPKIPNDCRSFVVEFEEPEKVKAFLPNGTFVTFKKIKVSVKFDIKEADLRFKSGNYNQKDIAYAEVNNIVSESSSDCMLTFVKDAEGNLEGKLLYKEIDGTDVSLPMELVNNKANEALESN